jgi:hypothetical protein
MGFVVNKVGLGQVFSEYFGFPCQFAFHRLLQNNNNNHHHHHHHHLSSGAGTVTAVPSGVSPHEKNTHQALISMAQQSQLPVNVTGMLDFYKVTTKHRNNDVENRKIVSHALQPLLQQMETSWVRQPLTVCVCRHINTMDT